MHTITEIYGEPGTGKTHAAIDGWPEPLVLDTAFTSIGFRSAEVSKTWNERGESWPILLKLYDYDEEIAGYRYKYLDSWPESTTFTDGYDTIILDNAADLRVLAVKEWIDQHDDYDWPQQGQWGEINDMIDGFLRALSASTHVVVISQMKDEYKNDTKTGERVRDGPTRMEYKADFRIRLEIDDASERHAWVEKNRHMDATSDEYGSRGTDIGPSFTFEELMMYSDIPQEYWSVSEL